MVKIPPSSIIAIYISMMVSAAGDSNAQGFDRTGKIVNGKISKTVLMAVNNFSFIIIYLLSACPKRTQAISRQTTVRPAATGMNGIRSKPNVPILAASSCILDAVMRKG